MPSRGGGRLTGQSRPVRAGVMRAVAKLAITLTALSVATFITTNAIPSDSARSALGRFASEEQLQVFRVQQGLDRPVFERYAYWVGNFVQGDWGKSLLNQRPVRDDVVPKFRRTVSLAAAGFFFMVPFAVLIGLFTGQRAGTRSDRAITVVTLVLSALPEFVVGILLLLTLAVALQLFPVTSGAVAFDGTSIATTLEAYALPTLALALVSAPYVIRMMRAGARDVSSAPYIRAAALRGVRGMRLSMHHVLPNAAIPTVNVLALILAQLIAGLVVTEAVFGFPGAGQLLVSAVQAQDLPTVQALVLLIGAFFVALNLLADLLLIALNPRLRT